MIENSIKEDQYGDNFQQKSKYSRDNLPRHYLDWSRKPRTYKTYENAITRIKLPKFEVKKKVDFWEVIVSRHSTRTFNDESISLNTLSSILFGMAGLTRIYPQFAFRTTPSAGGLYPIEIYPIINNVEEIEQGVYHYDILHHELEYLKGGNFRKEVAEACLGQKMAYDSAINFIWTAVIERSKWKYLQRCYRYIYMDCGHIGQNFYLIAEALELGACTIGAIYDDELNDLLGIDGKTETAIYVGVIGKKLT
ncbi:MAG: SagB/ThcOx family dehydrogenase [Promethearchaeota archaeon]